MILDPPRRRSLGIQLTPMVDVVFNVMTFFIIFTVFRGSEAAIGLRLPKAVTAEQHAATPLVVTVQEAGGFFVNGYRLDRSAFEAELARTLGRKPEQTVIIKADRSVRYERLVEALDAVRENGGTRIALAVEPKTPKPPGTPASR